MQAINTTGIDLYVAALQTVVADGDFIEVDESLAAQLAQQGWRIKATKRSTNTKADEAVPQEN